MLQRRLIATKILKLLGDREIQIEPCLGICIVLSQQLTESWQVIFMLFLLSQL